MIDDAHEDSHYVPPAIEDRTDIAKPLIGGSSAR